MRKLIGTLVIVGVCVWAAKKVHLLSYAGTLWSQIKCEAKYSVPTRFEIERVRHEIANLDSDLNGKVRPIAEDMAAISRLQKDIARNQTKLEELKTELLVLTQDAEGSTNLRIKLKLQREFDGFKRLETNLQSMRQLLEAKESSLAAKQDQLAKVVSKKREYELRLAQLETNEERLQVARMASGDLQFDTSRINQIEAALAEIETRHDVEEKEMELKTGGLLRQQSATTQRAEPQFDVNAIRAYLEGKTTTVSNNK